MIHEVLHPGRENAQTGRELSTLLRLPIRELTQLIEAERRQGYPICASTGINPGYFLAADQDEMQAYCNSLLRRAGEIHKTRRACLKTLATLPLNTDNNQ